LELPSPIGIGPKPPQVLRHDVLEPAPLADAEGLLIPLVSRDQVPMDCIDQAKVRETFGLQVLVADLASNDQGVLGKLRRLRDMVPREREPVGKRQLQERFPLIASVAGSTRELEHPLRLRDRLWIAREETPGLAAALVNRHDPLWGEGWRDLLGRIECASV